MTMPETDREPLGFTSITDIPSDHPVIRDKQKRAEQDQQDIDFYNKFVAGKQKYAGQIVAIARGGVIASTPISEYLKQQKDFWENVDRQCQELNIDRRFDVSTYELPEDTSQHQRFSLVKLSPRDSVGELQQDIANRNYFSGTVLLNPELAGRLVFVAQEKVISTSSVKTEIEFLNWMLQASTQAQLRGAMRGFIGFVDIFPKIP